MDICCENIRYNWTGGIDKNDQFYEIIWLNWCKKFKNIQFIFRQKRRIW